MDIITLVTASKVGAGIIVLIGLFSGLVWLALGRSRDKFKNDLWNEKEGA